MKIIDSPRAMQNHAMASRLARRRTALVPTMGALHEGHLSLIRRARRLASQVVVSIFVNPIQFGPNEDFERYPRPFEEDQRRCEEEGVDILFCPKANDVFAPDHSTYVEETTLSQGLCGAGRPGHFRGVATIVLKLFNLVLPDVALFGQKDAQQARIIRRMVRDLNLPVEIVLAPIVREPDGLAMSSRNSYLSETERKDALCLYEALVEAERLFNAGERNTSVLIAAMRNVIGRHPLARIEYVVCVDDETLQPVDYIEPERACLAALCVHVGRTRLIDNTVLGGSPLFTTQSQAAGLDDG